MSDSLPQGANRAARAPAHGLDSPMGTTVKVSQIMAKLQENSVLKLLQHLGWPDRRDWWETNLERFEEAYSNYALSVERFLMEADVGARWRRGPYFALKVHERMGPGHRRLHLKYREIERYLNLDHFNAMLHSRILADRTAALAQFFLSGPNLPSFQSFHRHRQFFLKLGISNRRFGAHESYARGIRGRTDWFETLKSVRDDVVVHGAGHYRKMWGFPLRSNELALTVFVPPPSDSKIKVDWVQVSIPRLVAEVDRFLDWFGRYGIRHSKRFEDRPISGSPTAAALKLRNSSHQVTKPRIGA